MAPIVAIITQQSSHYRHHHTTLITITIADRSLHPQSCKLPDILSKSSSNNPWPDFIACCRGVIVFGCSFHPVCCVLLHLGIAPHIVARALCLLCICVFVYCPSVASRYCPILLHCQNGPRIKQGNQASAPICTFSYHHHHLLSSQLSLEVCGLFNIFLKTFSGIFIFYFP